MIVVQVDPLSFREQEGTSILVGRWAGDKAHRDAGRTQRSLEPIHQKYHIALQLQEH